MAMQPLSLGVRANPDRTNDSGAAVLINCYAEDAGEEGAVRYPIYACDSFASWAALTGSGSGVCRGMLNLDDTTLYVVTGSRLNRTTTVGVATDMAAIAGSGPVYMARNRKATPQIAIVPSSGGKLYIVESNTVTDMSTLEATGVTVSLFNSVCAIDGYFVCTCSDGTWFVSGIDASTIDDLDFSSAASNPDGLTRGIVRGRDLCLMGPRSTEFFANTGGADFPFERTHATQLGIYAGPTAVSLTATLDGSLADTVIWCATNADGAYVGVLMLGGYEARKISAPWVDRAIRDATASTLRAFSYTREGTTFYALTSSTFTAEYNTRTGFWHKRTSDGIGYWRVVDAATFAGQTIFGDFSAAFLWKAQAITRNTSYVLTLRQSLDNGSTWNTGRTATIGPTGSTQRIKFNRLGQAKESGRVLELVVSNAVIENGSGIPMTVRPPIAHAWPNPTIMHTLHVDVTKGVSLTDRSFGIKQIAANVDGGQS